MGQYHVMWKFPSMKTQRATYEAPSLQTVLRILAKAEGVSPATTDQLFIHYHSSDGSVIEVFTHDKDKGVTAFDYEQPQKSNVVPLNPGKSDKHKKKNKPHFRLPTTPNCVVGAQGLYSAFQA